MCSVFSCSLIFSLPLILTLVVASISHFFTTAIKFPCFSSKKWSSLFLISRSSSLSVKIWLLRGKREREPWESGWETKFSYPWCYVARARELRYHEKYLSIMVMCKKGFVSRFFFVK